MLTLFTAPSATTTLTQVGTYSSALFTDLLPVIYIGAGFIIGGLLISFVIGRVIAGASKVLGKGRGGRRGRRR